MANYKKSDAYTRAQAKARERYHTDPDIKWTKDLAKKFGLTPDDYVTMLEAQDGGCAICGDFKPGGRPRSDGTVRLAVDHCHTTGKVRGLLCRRCNVVIGKVADDTSLLGKAMSYLDHHSQT